MKPDLAHLNEHDHQTMRQANAEEIDLMIEDLTSLVELNQDWESGCCAGSLGCFLCVGGTFGTSGTFFCYCLL
jgi:hypothetical protein